MRSEIAWVPVRSCLHVTSSMQCRIWQDTFLRCFPFPRSTQLSGYRLSWEDVLEQTEKFISVWAEMHFPQRWTFRACWTFPVKLPEPASWLCFRSKSLSKFPIANFHQDIRRNFLVVSSSNLQLPPGVEAKKLGGSLDFQKQLNFWKL